MKSTTKKELVVHCRVCGIYIGRENIRGRKYMCLTCLNQKRRNEYVKVTERKKKPKAPPKTKEERQAINRAAYLKKHPNSRQYDMSPKAEKPPKRERKPYIRKPRLKKLKTCCTCKVEKDKSEFEGFNRICKCCKEAAIKPKIYRSHKIKPAKKHDAPVAVENVKIQALNNPAKMQTVKLTADRFGRDKKIVRKGWEKTLAQIKKKCLT